MIKTYRYIYFFLLVVTSCMLQEKKEEEEKAIAPMKATSAEEKATALPYCKDYLDLKKHRFTITDNNHTQHEFKIEEDWSGFSGNLTVFSAISKQYGKVVIKKMKLKELIKTQQAQAARENNCINLLGFYRVSKDVYWAVMEQGEPMGEKPISIENVLQAAEELARLQQQGLGGLDVGVTNFLLYKGKVTFIDFGDLNSDMANWWHSKIEGGFEYNSILGDCIGAGKSLFAQKNIKTIIDKITGPFELNGKTPAERYNDLYYQIMDKSASKLQKNGFVLFKDWEYVMQNFELAFTILLTGANCQLDEVDQVLLAMSSGKYKDMASAFDALKIAAKIINKF